MLIDGRELVRVDEVDKCAQVQYRGTNFERSRKMVMVQDFNCGQMRVSGCNGHYEFVLGAGAKAKSVTNNLPLLSVLVAVIYSLYCFDKSSPSPSFS